MGAYTRYVAGNLTIKRHGGSSLHEFMVCKDNSMTIQLMSLSVAKSDSTKLSEILACGF